MKSSILILLIFVSMPWVSCKKDQSATQTTPSMLVGKWTVVNEKWTWSQPVTGQILDSTYIGRPGDYYEFTADSNLFAYVGIYYDTAKYYFVDAYHIQIKPSTWSGVSVYCSGGCFGPEFAIKALTANSLILSESALTPEGPHTDSITLIR